MVQLFKKLCFNNVQMKMMPLYPGWIFSSPLLKHWCFHHWRSNCYDNYAAKFAKPLSRLPLQRQILLFDTASESSQFLSAFRFCFRMTVTVFIWLFKAKFSFLMMVSWTLLGDAPCTVCSPAHVVAPPTGFLRRCAVKYCQVCYFLVECSFPSHLNKSMAPNDSCFVNKMCFFTKKSLNLGELI